MIYLLRMSLFVELSIILAVAAGISFVMRALRQPLIVGHIITGLVVGSFIIQSTHTAETFELFGQLGIAFLLFVVGIHLSPDVIKKFGRVAVVTGIGQVAITMLLGWILALMLGFSGIASFYIAGALAFSSTIIILKLITDRGDLDTLYANIAIGFLLVQDVLAIGLLLVIPTLASGDASAITILEMLFTGTALILGIALVSHYVLPLVDTFIAGSLEMLMIFAVAWGMGVAAIFSVFGFAIESGALIAGIALSRLASRFEISSRLTPLRDFFLVVFFIVLGSHMDMTSIGEVIVPAIILSLLVLIGNPLIVVSILGALGYRKKTSLQTGLTVAQISEFSLILIALGVRVGHVDAQVLNLITLVTLITIFGSSYLMMYPEKIYKALEKYLDVFERASAKDTRASRQKYDVMIFGCNRYGHDVFEYFKHLKKKLLVVDMDPKIVKRMEEHGVSAELGDASNVDFLETLNFQHTDLIVSTIPDDSTNHLLNNMLASQNPKAHIVLVARSIDEAMMHYDHEADYVVLPHVICGEHALKVISTLENKGPEGIKKLRKKHKKVLQKRLQIEGV